MISTARGALGPAVITMLMLETVMKTVMKMRSVFVWHVARWQWHVALRAPRSAMTQCARRRGYRYTLHQDSGVHRLSALSPLSGYYYVLM